MLYFPASLCLQTYISIKRKKKLQILRQIPSPLNLLLSLSTRSSFFHFSHLQMWFRKSISDRAKENSLSPLWQIHQNARKLNALTVCDKPIPLIPEETVTLHPLINLSTKQSKRSTSHSPLHHGEKNSINLIPTNLTGLKKLLWCYLCLICIVMERSQLLLIIPYNLIPIIELNSQSWKP